MLTNILAISLGAILTNNFIFSQFLGCCPFLGCSSKVDTATGMGLAVVFVMGLASAICWVIDTYILIPLGLAFLETLADWLSAGTLYTLCPDLDEPVKRPDWEKTLAHSHVYSS